MNLTELQSHLKATNRYFGEVDGKWGNLTYAGVLMMLTDGPDWPLTDEDLKNLAARNNLSFAQVKAVCEVEAAGAGFYKGKAKILPEPHRFSRNTQHRFDQSNPDVSYPSWGMRPYPASQDARYAALLKMVSLDVDAGFASASYGKFQIMGENFKLCGYQSSVAFAEAMARDEMTQSIAFEAFLKSTGAMDKLRRCTSAPVTCEAFCAAYNGSAFKKNSYDQKMAAAIARFGG